MSHCSIKIMPKETRIIMNGKVYYPKPDHITVWVPDESYEDGGYNIDVDRLVEYWVTGE